MQQKTAQAGVFTFSNLSATNVLAVPMTPNAGQQPTIVADATPQAKPPQQQQQITVAASVNGALAFNETKPHPLAEGPQIRPQTQNLNSQRELSETEELELEAQAIAAERKENDVMPAASKQTPRRTQIASTNSIPVSATPVTSPGNDEAGDPLPPAAKSGWSIQVGAFPNAKAAKERLNDAKESATALLAKVTPYTEKVSKDSTNLFRARFAGFKSEWHAKRTCQTLLRHNFDCIVAKN